MPADFKIPQSVLVVVHTAALDVLLLRRADTGAQDFWQSVTGSKNDPNETWAETAAREVWEETSIDCRVGSPLADHLRDWRLENVYAIYPRWAHRYAPGVTHNTERVFGLCVSAAQAVRLSPHEHTHYEWLPYTEAASRCFSGSNAAAILRLADGMGP